MHLSMSLEYEPSSEPVSVVCVALLRVGSHAKHISAADFSRGSHFAANLFAHRSSEVAACPFSGQLGSVADLEPTRQISASQGQVSALVFRYEFSRGGVPREQKMLKGHLPRVIYHQIYSVYKHKLFLLSWEAAPLLALP